MGSSSLLAIPMVLAQITAPTSAATAVSSTKEMYSYWCTAERSEKPLCKHHALIAKMTATTDPEQRKALATEVKSLYTQAKTMSAGGGPGSVNPFAKDYADMKIAYCATSPAGAKTLCSTAASRFSPSGSSGSVTSSTSQAMEWFCAKESSELASKDSICKRASLLKQMRDPTTTPDAKKDLLKQLKEHPAPAYGTTQAIYADFCKIKTNGELPLCTSLRRTAESKKMASWYCASSEEAKQGLWCRRSELVAKLSKLPSTDSSKAEERKAISAQLSSMMKPTLGGGPSPIKQMSDEIRKAKMSYCAMHEELRGTYCASPNPP